MSTADGVAVLDQWDQWVAAATDRLMSLDERIEQLGGSLPDASTVRLDLAAAFVCRKAVAARVDAIRAAPASAADASARPLVDDHGAPVAADLSSAAELLRAVLDRIDSTVSGAEHAHRSVATDRLAARRDLEIAERLAGELGHHVQRAAAARDRFAQVSGDPGSGAGAASGDLAAIAAEAATLRAELERLHAARAASFDRWRDLPARIEALRAREAEVRALVDTCRAKVTPLPLLAVPSVDALGPVRPIDELTAMPWPAARMLMEPFLSRVDRLGAAFDEVHRRFGAVLARRDELRGLLHAFRDKAAASGHGESADLEPLLRGAERVLWSAPCDLDVAEQLVSDYTRAVNALVAAPARGPGGGARDGAAGTRAEGGR